MAGYIKLHRGWRDTDGLTPSTNFSEWEAWLWLLENCAWREMSRWNAKGEEIRLSPGQIHVSLRSLSKAWGWHESSVRRFLVRLEKVKKAVQLPAQSGTVLTIVNWAKYQACDTASDTASDTAATQPRHTQEEGKEGKEEKKVVALARATCPEGVSKSVWSDFTALRKAKRAPITPTALSAIAKEAEKVGWTLEAALTECVSRGWQGFKADWVKSRSGDAEMTMPC